MSVMYPSMADYLNWMDSNHFQLIMVGGGLGWGGGCTGRQEPVRKMEEAERTRHTNVLINVRLSNNEVMKGAAKKCGWRNRVNPLSPNSDENEISLYIIT